MNFLAPLIYRTALKQISIFFLNFFFNRKIIHIMTSHEYSKFEILFQCIWPHVTQNSCLIGENQRNSLFKYLHRRIFHCFETIFVHLNFKWFFMNIGLQEVDYIDVSMKHYQWWYECNQTVFIWNQLRIFMIGIKRRKF